MIPAVKQPEQRIVVMAFHAESGQGAAARNKGSAERTTALCSEAIETSTDASSNSPFGQASTAETRTGRTSDKIV